MTGWISSAVVAVRAFFAAMWEERDEDVLADIEAANSPEDLHAILEDEDELCGGENDAFLAVALELAEEGLLTKEDWQAFYEAAEPGSELETVADEWRQLED